MLVALVVPYRMIGLAPWAAWPTLTDPHPWLVPEGERPSDAYRVWVPGDRFDLGFGTFVRQGLRHGIRVVQDYEPASSRRLGAFLSAVAGRPFGPGDDAVRFTGALLGDPPIERPALLDLVSARHVVVPEDRPPADRARGWIEVTRHPRYAIYRNDRALSRAYLVQRARFVPDEAAALDAIVDPSFDGQTEAVVVGGPDGPEARSLADGPRAPATAIPMAIDEPERIVLEVEPARASLVVVTDAFAPGWSARVDGAERELRQVNYLVRGVLVAPGDRRVELRYAAPGFVPGLALALSGWGVALVVIASARTRRRRSPT